MAFLSREALLTMGFKSLGEDVLISDKASIYNAANIKIGSQVRISDFAILSAGSGGIVIGNHVHVGCHSVLLGAGIIELQDFSGISPRVTILSSSDDFSGAALIGPMVPRSFRNVIERDVVIGRHVVIGSGSTVLPGASIVSGTAIGAMSLVKSAILEPGIYAGIPVKMKKQRSKQVFELEKAFLERGNDRQ